MKVLTLQGSARKKGNTATVLGWVEEELLRLGHEVESIYLHSKQMKGCMGCAKCKQIPDGIGCVQKDEVPAILESLIRADLAIFASPLYFWGVTAQLKTVIDRTYSLYTQYHQPGHASLVDGQRQALLVTGAGPWDNNAEATFTAFERMQKPHKAVNAGHLYIGKCTTPEELGETAKQQALEFASLITA